MSKEVNNLAGKRNILTDEDSLGGFILAQEKDDKKFAEVKDTRRDIKSKYPAKSFMSDGRGCYKCSGNLVYFEQNKDTKIEYVQCRKCGLVQSLDETENENNDSFYRYIPEDMIQYYMNSREEYLKKKEEAK